MAETVVMQLSDLHKAPYNPNEMPEDEYRKLVHNIREEGYLEYIVVNKRTDYTIVSGNHRYDALLELGWTEAPVIVIDVSLEKEKALNLSFNRIGGVLNQEKVSNLIVELERSGFGEFEITGLSGFEFDMIFAGLEDDPYENEFDDMDLTFKTKNEKERGSPRPKQEKKVKPKIITCPHCGEEIEV